MELSDGRHRCAQNAASDFRPGVTAYAELFISYLDVCLDFELSTQLAKSLISCNQLLKNCGLFMERESPALWLQVEVCPFGSKVQLQTAAEIKRLNYQSKMICASCSAISHQVNNVFECRVFDLQHQVL